MGDGITFRMVTEPFHQMIADKQRRMPNAARWAVRQGGRVAKAAARAQAPVLKDKTAASVRQLKRGEAGANQPVRGLLKASITPSKNLNYLGESEFSIKVGPRGPRVYLYAAKIEQQAHYMDAGRRAAHAAMSRIAREAFERVWRG